MDSRRESHLNWFKKKTSRVPLSLFPLSFSAFVDPDKGLSLCLPWDQMYPGSGQDAKPWKPLCSSCYRTLKLCLAALLIGIYEWQRGVTENLILSKHKGCKVMPLNCTFPACAFQQGWVMVLYNNRNQRDKRCERCKNSEDKTDHQSSLSKMTHLNIFWSHGPQKGGIICQCFPQLLQITVAEVCLEVGLGLIG